MSTSPIRFDGQVAIVTGAGHGLADLTSMTPEQVEANLATACDLTDFETPESMNDASRCVARGLAQHS